MPASATRISSMEIAAEGTRSSPSGPRLTPLVSTAGPEAVPMIGTARVWGTAAGIAPRLIHSATSRCWTSSTTASASSRQRKSGSGPPNREQVAAFDRRVPNSQCWPGQVVQPAAADLQRWPPGAVVEQRVGIELGDDPAAVAELLDCRRRGLAGVHPCIERHDDRRGDDLDRFDQPVQRHQASIRVIAGAARRPRLLGRRTVTEA